MFEKRISARLTYQKQAGLYRNPPPIAERNGKYLYTGGRKVLNLASNDYLGLGSSKALKEKVAANFEKYGASASSSRLVSAHYNTISEAEAALAEYFGYEAALIYPSGYQANLGLISTLFEKGDTIFFDKHIHASSVKGMLLSKAFVRGYCHNNMEHLARRLTKDPEGPSAVLTESLFSMDGDRMDIAGLKVLKDRFDLFTIVDEAHAFGVLGEKGRGLAGYVADISVGTFGKALGLFGAFVLLPKTFRDFLLNFSSPLIYTTTLPEAHGASALDVLQMVARSNQQRARLRQVSLLMKKNLCDQGFHAQGDAHIIAVRIGDEATAMTLSQMLFKRGFFVFPARFPSVPLGQAILRLSLTARHTPEDIKSFISAIKDAYAELKPKAA